MVANFVIRTINRSNHIRGAVYLDTCAWSHLAKRQVPFDPLIKWVEKRGYYLWIARFSLIELAGDTRLYRPLVELFTKFPVLLLDYADNELEGRPWYSVKINYQSEFHFDPDHVEELVEEITHGTLSDARKKVLEDGELFGRSIQKSIPEIPNSKKQGWSGFLKLVENRIRIVCEQNGYPVNEDAIQNKECYIGERLLHSVVYWRYFISRQKWKPSDYGDLLHTLEMPYARVVITERNLTECIRQVARKTNIMTPDVYPYTEFLQDPFKCEEKYSKP